MARNLKMSTGVSRRKLSLRIGAGIAALVLFAALFFFFILLIKVKGQFGYLYNFFVKTDGSLPVSTYETMEPVSHNVPYAVPSTKPERFLVSTKLEVEGLIVTDYQRPAPIRLDESSVNLLSAHMGLLTFRGNYARTASSYQSVLDSATRLKKSWSFRTGRFLKDDGVNYWSGNGWTGQPIAVHWSNEWKAVMNLYPTACQKSDLTEIIYPGMDGKIHFLDIETGAETRPAINVGMIFKGTCSVHPTYPLLICGSGDSATGLFGEQICARIFIYSLIDGRKLYEFAANDPFSTRSWHGFDSSPIFAEEADTVIYPGENGVLYTLRLNTSFDKEHAILSIAPEQPVKYAYTSYAAGERFEASENGNGSGSESSPVVYDHYLFFGDNGGIFQCLDLNTMKPVWVQDLLEDINSSPVLEQDADGKWYIYVGTTLKFHYDSHHIGEAGIYKLNAQTGEIVWKKPYAVHTVLGLAGGVLASGASGCGEIADYLFYAISKVPSVESGYVVAISKTTGEEYWRYELPCDAWSSGCLVYTGDGHSRLVQCCGNGDVLLMDTLTGKVLSKVSYNSNIESTPAIVGNRIVVGLRSEYIVSMEIH